MTTMTLEAAWALLVRDRFGLQALGTTRLRTDPEAAGRVLAMVAPREHRGVVEQVLGAAAELAVGQPGEALRSLRAAREAGVSLAVLDRALADIGLDGEGPMRSTGTPRPAKT